MATSKTIIKGYIFQDVDDLSFNYQVSDYSYSWQAKVCEIEHEIEFEIPSDYHPVKSQIEALTKDLGVLSEAFHTKRAEITSKIKDLQCIGFDSPVVAAQTDDIDL
jgi:hypothetical protein